MSCLTRPHLPNRDALRAASAQTAVSITMSVIRELRWPFLAICAVRQCSERRSRNTVHVGPASASPNWSESVVCVYLSYPYVWLSSQSECGSMLPRVGLRIRATVSNTTSSGVAPVHQSHAARHVAVVPGTVTSVRTVGTRRALVHIGSRCQPCQPSAHTWLGACPRLQL